MPKIKVLSEHLVNKIAAGEVVERPASVIKEMMENSLDAQATQLSVEVEDGGKKLIRITDNGCGIAPDDLPLAFTPHATSKLTSDEQLFSIQTMGFRGEALASIGSIAQVEIISRPADAIEGAKFTVDGGNATPVAPAPSAPGTTITVRNLFFNTPARRKFLRTANTEMSHISEQFFRLALANTNVHMTLSHNGRTIHDLPAGQSLQDRIAALFSNDLANSLFSIHRKDGDLEIAGMIAHPQQARNNSQWQYVFLNGRHIRDRFVSHAIREAYRGMMEINRQPIVFLFITMPPELVDVNVHPAKTEVRFSNSNQIHSITLAAIRDRLLGSDLSVQLKTKLRNEPAKPNQYGEPESTTQSVEPSQTDKQQNTRQAMLDFFKSLPKKNDTTQINRDFYNQPAAVPTPPQPSTIQQSDQDNDSQTEESFTTETAPQSQFVPQPQPAEQQQRPETTVSDEIPQSSYGPVIQIHNTYLIEQTEDGLAIIDQHALHERIMYEKLSNEFNKGPLPSQRRLIPEVVDVTPRQLATVEEQQDILNALGISIEQFGPRSIAIQSFPILLEKSDPAEFITDVLDIIIEQSGKVTREELIHHVIDMMSCKAAIKAGDPLTEPEIRALLDQAEQLLQTGTCPHGRPTTLRMSLTELEKQFKRL